MHHEIVCHRNRSPTTGILCHKNRPPTTWIVCHRNRPPANGIVFHRIGPLPVCFFVSGNTPRDLYVGVTDVSPADVPPFPRPPNYKVCSHFSGDVEGGSTETIPCSFPVSGRYVIVQLTSHWTVLSLCEVEVFAGKRLWPEHISPSFLLQ